MPLYRGGSGQIVIWVAKMPYDASYGVRGLAENVKIPFKGEGV